VNYFAYGANMSQEVMRTSAPAHRFLGAARLAGHRLAFTRRSVITGTGVADIVRDAGAAVWGALYLLDPRDFEQLDRKEGLGSAYVREQVSVTLGQEEIHGVLAYTVRVKEAVEIRPSAAYLHLLLDGAAERGLPEPYLATLELLRSTWGLP
jgi:gamma-glutamylcyclotransferase (GGCT)/AIG2-like uncharacterized protein YtfP